MANKVPNTMFEAVQKFMSISLDSNIALKRAYDDWWLKQVMANKRLSFLVRAQKLDLEEHKDLGSDLAAARFVVGRSGGRVRAKNGNWILKEKELPKINDNNFTLSYIDLSKSGLISEGIDNLIGLEHLESLDLSTNPQLDDFACDMLARQFRNSTKLRDINVSFNPYISLYGVEVLFRIPSLKRITAVSTLASSHEQKELFKVAAEVERDCEVII